MRKLLIILLGFCCSLLFVVDGNASLVSRHAVPKAVLAVDQATTAQWVCEREYNSDFNLLRANCGAPAVSQSPVASREEHTTAERLGMACGGHCKELRTPCFDSDSSNLLAGAHAVDLYIYRLRRLLI